MDRPFVPEFRSNISPTMVRARVSQGLKVKTQDDTLDDSGGAEQRMTSLKNE